MKKIWIIMLCALIVISLCACGEKTAETPAESMPEATTETPAESMPEATTETVVEPESLESLVAAQDPANIVEELEMSFAFATEQYDKTLFAIADAGLSEDETYAEMTADWEDLIYGTVASFMADSTMYGMTAEELATNNLYQTSAELYISLLSMDFKQMCKVESDPQEFLDNYDIEIDFQQQETDGTWPTGYFFDGILSPLSAYDSYYTDNIGEKNFDIPGGMEVTFSVNMSDSAAFEAYLTELADAGFSEISREDSQGMTTWYGDRGDMDSEDYVFVILNFNGSAEGTDDAPQFVLMAMNWDYFSYVSTY